ncbi:MAG: hypothetical protein JNJ91_06060 [Flavobacteriales bacterium]|nr:hypothetical protein [Flavobacteriales bacterium]
MASFFLTTDEVRRIKHDQDKAIQLYAIFGAAVIILGVIMLVVGRFISDDNTSQTIIQLGGGFVATLSGFQVKEVVARRGVVTGLELIATKLEKYKEEEPTEEEAKQVNAFLQDLMKRLLNLG